MRARSLSAVPALSRQAVRHRPWTLVASRLLLALICLLTLLLVPSDGYLGPAARTLALNRAIGGDGFQLAAWEVQALAQKARDAVAQPGAALTPAEQHDLVVAYFDAILRIRQLSAEIERIYADPTLSDHAAAAAPYQAELDALRAEQRARRSAVERILERQVAAVLQEEGLTTLGGVWPPVRFQFTESPNYLIVSPRNRIFVERGIYLDPSLPVARMEEIEEAVQRSLDNTSALVEGTGGFSSYPTMVIEEPSLEWVLSTIAHEWGHLYLAFRPLGWHYYDDGGTRTLNETTVSILGDEISEKVLARYYPERLRPAPWPRPLWLRSDWWGPGPQPAEFEFGPFMRATRLEVDRLLAEGRIAEAEAFMEARRQVLVGHGYAIRKLNQAYFAFHGSYAVGAFATDPIGGKLRALRQRSASLLEFIQVVSRMTSVADLDAALSAAREAPGT